MVDGDVHGLDRITMEAQKRADVEELVARVTSKGQVTIPIEIRRLLGIAIHDKLAFVVDGNEIRLVRRGSIVEYTAGALRGDRAPLTAEELRRAAEEAIAEARTP